MNRDEQDRRPARTADYWAGYADGLRDARMMRSEDPEDYDSDWSPLPAA